MLAAIHAYALINSVRQAPKPAQSRRGAHAARRALRKVTGNSPKRVFTRLARYREFPNFEGVCESWKASLARAGFQPCYMDVHPAFARGESHRTLPRL